MKKKKKINYLSCPSRIEVSVKRVYLYVLIYLLMIAFSFGLLLPICHYHFIKYVTNHRYINGHRLRFDGKVLIFILIYLIWITVYVILYYLLSFIFKYVDGTSLIPQFIIGGIQTLLLSITVSLHLNKYIQTHTHFVGYRGVSFYRTDLWGLIKKIVIRYIVNYISLGLLFPIAFEAEQAYTYSRSVISNKKVIHHPHYLKFYPRYLLDFLFTIVTAGIYYPYAYIRLLRLSAVDSHLKGRLYKK